MAPAATLHANTILLYLSNRLGSNICWSKGIWPPNSCNLNPLDYSIWWVEDRACNRSHDIKKSLKTVVEDAWNRMDRTYVRDICLKEVQEQSGEGAGCRRGFFLKKK